MCQIDQSPSAVDVQRLSDRDLLLGGRVDRVMENRASARRWLRMREFHQRRAALQPPPRDAGRQAVLTARQETVVEIGELWGMPERWVRAQLNVVLCLTEHLPEVLALCVEDSLDPYRATLVTDALRDNLTRPEEIARFRSGITGSLRKHRARVDDDDETALVTCTPRQLRNRLSYQVRILRSSASEDRFRRKHADRCVTARGDQDGMGWLSVNATIDQVRLAHQRLTLAAKAKRAAGDARTLDQLRSDLALDLLVGRAGDERPPAFARPIVNLTVPMQTVMGISDHPGELSGGEVIPAGLCRMIAARPGSTWFRMLTDPVGQLVELSTKSYKPTAPIWRHVVAERSACFRPGCDRPATECEDDHRVPWPAGRTSAENLWPGCPVDHRAKHTPGFDIEQDADGSFVLRTRAGFRHRIPRSTHPSDAGFVDVDLADGFQLSAAEIVDAVMSRRRRDADRPIDLTAIWEWDADEGFYAAEELDQPTEHDEVA